MKQTLLAGLPALGLSLDPAQVEQFCAFGAALLEKNQVMNLTAITEPAAVAQLHFLDSLALLHQAEFAGRRVIDVGCGAGFPGVPLKIAEPSMHLTLLDSLTKRIHWLQAELLPALGVEADCIAQRAEDYAAAHREQFDIAVSRAVARLNILAELCLPFVRVGGVFLAMKGEDGHAEAEEARWGIEKLGGEIESIAASPVAGTRHCAIRIRKVHPTPAQFPRRFQRIKQRPL